MAKEEQFSLCWTNFNSNLSAGFQESLYRGDLVDVTLAAEGQLMKAHRLVLSSCSPYFREMFTQMPANQHAFVFLKDVSHTTLKDLIQFMYSGEVCVQQDALQTFISTAEALQIKGLTEIAKPVTQAPPQTPVKVSTTTTSPRSSSTPDKFDCEYISNEKPVVVQKRPVIRSNTPILQRTDKSSYPFEALEPISQQHIITTIETKSNAEEADQDIIYVEDDSGDTDMKDDEIYFTENDDVNADGASGFVEPDAETEFQSICEVDGSVSYVTGFRGCRKLKWGRYSFTKNKMSPNRTYWSCARAGLHKCKARVVTVTKDDAQMVVIKNAVHNHEPF